MAIKCASVSALFHSELTVIDAKSRFRKSCGSGQSADEEHDGGGVEEGAGRGDGGLEVLCQSPVAVDPGLEQEEHLMNADDLNYPNLVSVLCCQSTKAATLVLFYF